MPAIPARSRIGSSQLARASIVLGILMFLLVASFSTRLVPPSGGDRGIYDSVAERMLAGDRLYVQVADNKDPLFYYLMVVERLIGPWSGYLFGLAFVVATSVIAALLLKRISALHSYHCVLFAVGVAYLVTGPNYDLGGTMPPGVFLSILAVYLACCNSLAWAGIVLALLLFTKLPLFPVAATFVLVQQIRTSVSRHNLHNIARLYGAAFASCLAIIIVMEARGEFGAYVRFQLENIVYSQENIMVTSRGLTGNVHNHLVAAAYFGKPLIIISAIAFVLVLVLHCTNGDDGARRTFRIATLASFLPSVAAISFLTIWQHHIGILYPFCIMAGVALLSFPWRRTSHLLLVELIMAVAVAWTYKAYYINPFPGPHGFTAAIAKADLPSLEGRALNTFTEGKPISYARIGTNNDDHHAATTRRDHLVCPWFHQYDFSSPEKLRRTISCASRADYVLVHLGDAQINPRMAWLPPNTDFDRLNARWKRYNEDVGSMLAEKFDCKSFENDIKVCRKRGLSRGFVDLNPKPTVTDVLP